MSTPVRMILVANQLPIEAEQRHDNSWELNWDMDSLVYQLRGGFLDEMIVFHVGCLKAGIHEHQQQEEVSKILLGHLCIPTFLPPEILYFYDGFCKTYLWPLFHSIEPLDFSSSIDDSVRPFWSVYVGVNKFFSEKVMEVCSSNAGENFIWIHDYHLMVLPIVLREKYVRMKIGFFLHIPFPPFERYRTLVVREEILKSLLNCDVIGFHSLDYARNFLSCCSRILGLKHKVDKGFLELEYHGRNIRIKVTPVGIAVNQIEPVMRWVEGEFQNSIGEHLAGKEVLLSIDDTDILEGIELKLLAMEHMLMEHQEEKGRTVLVQILNRAQGIPYNITLGRIRAECERINKMCKQPGYTPIYLVERKLSTLERFAYYTIAECFVVTHLRDGMNLYPYEYTACRQCITGFGSTRRSIVPCKKSMLVMSEFMGCSLSLSGALRVNPWHVEEVAMKMYEAISMDDRHKNLRHRRNYKHICKHDLVHSSKSFYNDMVETWKNQSLRAFVGLESGFQFKAESFDSRLQKLPIDTMASSYNKAKTRAILLDCDGTLIPIHSVEKKASENVISILNDLCNDKKNVVFVVSGREKDILTMWFKSCKNLGIAAEHGSFLRWPGNEEWESYDQSSDMHWKGVTNHIMEFYTSAIDGSYVERKKHALVWNYHNAELKFASSQAKELLDHLENILANDPVTVKSGKFIVEVESQGVNKGTVAKTILESMDEKVEKGDKFILSIGDDKSDEAMFEILNATVEDNLSSPNPVFTCTIGLNSATKAKYYLSNTHEVIDALEQLGTIYLLKEDEPLCGEDYMS